LLRINLRPGQEWRGNLGKITVDTLGEEPAVLIQVEYVAKLPMVEFVSPRAIAGPQKMASLPGSQTKSQIVNTFESG
jgi:hypothetical protein